MDQCQPAGPEEDIDIARRAFAEGDLGHAMHHLAGAIAVHPEREDWLALLDEVLDSAGEDPLRLTPIQGTPPPFFGTVALHSHTLARLGRHAEAIGLILQVALVAPSVPFVQWAINWLSRPETHGQAPPSRVTWFLSQVVQQYPALANPQGGGRVTLDKLPELIQVVQRTQKPDAGFLVSSVSVLRRLEHLDEALRNAQAAYDLDPGYASSVAVAMARRDRREVPETIAAYQDALRFKPNDVAVRLDLGDLMWDHGQGAKALAWYDEALALEPNQPWGVPSACYLRWAVNKDESQRLKLLAMADLCPDNRRAVHLAGLASAYFGYLPEPSDATTNVLKQWAREGKDLAGSSSLKITLSCLEAPSNYLAAPALFNSPCSVLALQNPDPRLPRRPVDRLLWKYDGLAPIVAVPPPTAEVAAVVEELARRPYSLSEWVRQASRKGPTLGPERIGDLLAVMVHPPATPEKMSPWGWVYRIQVASALILAQVEKDWQGSARRKALLSLAYGPLDWTVDAALVALTAIAREDETAVPEIAGVFRDLTNNLPTGGASCYYPVLLWCSLQLPGLSGEERSSVRQQLRAWLTPQEDVADTQFKLARIHEKNGDRERSWEAVSQAIEANPGHLDARAFRGHLALDRKRFDQATADFSAILERQPGAAFALLGRGEARFMAGQTDESFADFTEAAKAVPGNWRAHYWIGWVHRLKRAHKEAVEAFTRAASCDNAPPVIYHLRGKSRLMLAQLDEALADQTRALELDPKLKGAWLDRAALHKSKGAIDSALADLTQVIHLDPLGSADAYNQRAAIHYQNKFDPESALRDHESALRLQPNDPSTCNYVAWILSACPNPALRNGARAVELATRACELTKWAETWCLDTLGVANAECGNFAEAVRHARKTVELATDEMRAEYAGRLKMFEEGRPYRDANPGGA